MQKDAESSITILPGANQNLFPEDISSREHLFEGCGYCLISTEIPVETCICAAETARKYGAQTIVKPAALKTLPDKLLKNTDIFVPNRKEAALLCPQETEVDKQAAFFFSLGCPVVIITLGHRGSYLRTKDMACAFPAAAFPSVDSTGGADAFIAALASYLTEGCPLEKAIPIATYAAGFCVSRTGVVPALVDKASLENHIRIAEPELLNFRV
ncbi:MAG: PfkB family carbohydrate kinase [Blautia hansenii]